MKNFAKKLVTLALGSAMALTVCAGVTGCSKERGPNDILLWAGGQWVGSDADNLRAYIEWYNQNNEIGVNIDLQIITDFEQKFSSATSSGDAPDIMIWDRFNTPTYVASKNLESLDDLIAEAGIEKSAYNATAYDEMSYGGVQYGLPLDLDLWGIYINMDIVNAYNKQNPSNKITCLWNADGSDKLDWTWEDALDTAKKLKGFTPESTKVTVKSGYDGTNIQEFFIHNYYSTGEDFLIDGKAHIDSEKGADLLHYLHDLYETGDDGYADQLAFVGGSLAMYMRPTYFTSYLERYAKSMNVRFMPQPAYSKNGEKLGENRGVMGGYGMAIPRPIYEEDRTEKWEAKKLRCWDFMKDWLYNEANMLKWAETSKTIPALLSTHDKAEVTGNKVLKDVVKYSDVYTIRPGVPGWTSVQTGVFNGYVSTFCATKNITDMTITDTIDILVKQTDNTLRDYGLQLN